MKFRILRVRQLKKKILAISLENSVELLNPWSKRNNYFLIIPFNSIGDETVKAGFK